MNKIRKQKQSLARLEQRERELSRAYRARVRREAKANKLKQGEHEGEVKDGETLSDL